MNPLNNSVIYLIICIRRIHFRLKRQNMIDIIIQIYLFVKPNSLKNNIHVHIQLYYNSYFKILQFKFLNNDKNIPR